MRFCDEDWEKLRKALDERGLTKYVARGAAEAVQALAGGREDPLLGAYMFICVQALEAAGFGVSAPQPGDEDPCPLCRLRKIAVAPDYDCRCGKPDCTPEKRVANIDKWIDVAADDQLRRFTGGASA